VLALMMGEALRLCGMAAAFPASALLGLLRYHQSHVAWVGGSLHDPIQPGFSFLVENEFYELLDVRGHARWAFPLVVLGTNSIAAYCRCEALMDPISQALVRHLPAVFRVLGPAFEPTLMGAGALLVAWLILLWMYRHRVFVKI
jgi:hypothetical protein